MRHSARPYCAFTSLSAARAPFATWGLHSALLAVGALASGCLNVEPELSETESAATVDSFQAAGCSTAVVIGLSKQIAQQAGCDNPNSFVRFTATGGISFSSNAVLPFLVKDARDDLQKVALTTPLQINSALRTIAQQYLLSRWFGHGLCGITAAAPIGSSNHEGGRAVDINSYSTRLSSMAAHGWVHDVPGDLPHFDHTGSPDNRGQDVKAFQELWNRNHPADKIATDGAYGAQTETRLKVSPATGFTLGPTCGDPTLDLDVVSIDGADILPPETKAHYSIVLVNSGQHDWPATTKLQLASDTTSVLHDASWVSAAVITTIGAVVKPGAQVKIELDITTPPEDAEIAISQVFELDDGTTMFGAINFAVTVKPGADPTSGEGTEGGNLSGGCAAGGGGAGWLAMALPALVRVRRRRR